MLEDCRGDNMATSSLDTFSRGLSRILTEVVSSADKDASTCLVDTHTTCLVGSDIGRLQRLKQKIATWPASRLESRAAT